MKFAVIFAFLLIFMLTHSASAVAESEYGVVANKPKIGNVEVAVNLAPNEGATKIVTFPEVSKTVLERYLKSMSIAQFFRMEQFMAST